MLQRLGVYPNFLKLIKEDTTLNYVRDITIL